MKRINLILLAAAISTGNLAAQNSRDEVKTGSGNEKVVFEKKFSDNVTVSTYNKVRTDAPARDPEPYELPFFDSFDFDDPYPPDIWTIIDANENGNTWDYGGDYGPGDTEIGFVFFYISEPEDDYFVSPPIIIPTAGTYHITFFLQTSDFNHSLSLLYGTDSNPENMNILKDYPEINTEEDWDFIFINFEIETSGIYYFTFHCYSDVDGWEWLCLDNVTIDAGQFVPQPDITFNNVYTPSWSCSLTFEEIIGAEVTNIGTGEIQEFTLTYKINELTPVTQTFTEKIGVYKSVTVYFDQTADFSLAGEYQIKFTALTPDEVNIENNETSIVINTKPINQFPFESDFYNSSDINDWYPAENSQWWNLNSSEGYYECNYQDCEVPLISRCFTLKNGEYRFSFNYMAGTSFFGMTVYCDFNLAIGKSGTDPSSWETIKTYEGIYTEYQIDYDVVNFNITENGDYVLAFMPGKFVYFRLYSTYFENLSGISTGHISDPVISLYPNPATNELRMESGELRIKNVEIFDVFGRPVGAYGIRPNVENEIVLDISHLHPGIYFILVQTKDGVVNSKFVVK